MVKRGLGVKFQVNAQDLGHSLFNYIAAVDFAIGGIVAVAANRKLKGPVMVQTQAKYTYRLIISLRRSEVNSIAR
jgi:hypothetical protein